MRTPSSIVLLLIACACAAAAEPVTVERIPAGALQPQAVADADGAIHLLWFAGAPDAGDLFYARRAADAAEFAPSVRVNSEPGAATAIGTIRGGQLAIGRGGRAHVAWNGSRACRPTSPAGGSGMLYARLAEGGGAFEPQRQLIHGAGALDGGGAVAADRDGRIGVFWHALAGAADESGAAVYVAWSADDGATFADEVVATTTRTGACGCCGMRAGVDATGAWYAVFRGAAGGDRDAILLAGGPRTRFAAHPLDRWTTPTCPMSLPAFAAAGDRAWIAWEGDIGLRLAAISGGRVAAPGEPFGERGKYPALAVNARGEVLVAWAEGTAWQRGGAVRWQRFDPRGAPLGVAGRGDGLPAWSLPTVVARRDGGFLVLY